MHSPNEASASPGRKRREQKEETRARILAAAARLFADRGFQGTSTAAIASEAALSHGALFVHFRTREELLDALIDEFARELAEQVRTEIGKERSLRSTLERHLLILERHEDLYARLVMEGPSLPERARAALGIVQSAVSYEMQRAAKLEQGSGKLRSIPQHLLFNTWIGLVHHYLLNRDLFAPGRSVIRSKRQELVDHFVCLVSRNGARR